MHCFSLSILRCLSRFLSPQICTISPFYVDVTFLCWRAITQSINQSINQSSHNYYLIVTQLSLCRPYVYRINYFFQMQWQCKEFIRWLLYYLSITLFGYSFVVQQVSVPRQSVSPTSLSMHSLRPAIVWYDMASPARVRRANTGRRFLAVSPQFHVCFIVEYDQLEQKLLFYH